MADVAHEALDLEQLVTGVLKALPEIDAFLTVSELDQSSARLAAAHPDRVKLVQVGESADGYPIRALIIGPTKPGPTLPLPEGTRAALLFGCPHPNEPIGAMMLEYFAAQLAANPDLVDKLGYTWYMVKCIDPDGTRLNEGWFKGPFTITNYATHFYRPAGHRQVEWNFPVKYKTLDFNSPIPETRALMRMIEEIKPAFMFSLHNAGFGGVYYYLTRAAEGLYPKLQGAALAQGLPLNLGEPEVPYSITLADAIYQMHGTHQTYDFLAQHSGKDPAPLINAGTSSSDYADRVAGTFTLVCEMPYFDHLAVNDLTLSSVVRREAVLASLTESQEELAWLTQCYGAVSDLLVAKSRFRTSVTNYLEKSPGQLAARRQWAETSPELDRPATEAEVFSSGPMAQFYRLLMLGMAVRMIEHELAVRAKADAGYVTDATVRLQATLRGVRGHFRGRCAQFESQLEYNVIPVRKLVAVQLAGALYTSQYLLGRL